ncbi:hypothetical protein AVEN_60252-1 [Araneus ventricosus]|uniref:Uncharacterized protein n=1 Tax=Araneus ventricosus TaxID=182803 RepID=A0A4Y2CYZ3_ARAVE|nr:hypothetical protein AVEN_60252-1 [Araneus ventricosus]
MLQKCSTIVRYSQGDNFEPVWVRNQAIHQMMDDFPKGRSVPSGLFDRVVVDSADYTDLQSLGLHNLELRPLSEDRILEQMDHGILDLIAAKEKVQFRAT